YSLMMPILGFIKCFAKFQKLGLKASNLPAIASLRSLRRGGRACPPSHPLRRGGRAICPACSGINAQHFLNLFPKVAKIARKRLFTSLSIFN
ncbi:MAG: hypothetical protein R6T98_01835, partial [Desulfatiglandales bacterium]